MARTASPKQQRTLEQRLWDSAVALRGNLEPSEYKHVVLGLVFLKYISHRFEDRRHAIEASLADPASDEKAIELVLQQAEPFAAGEAQL